MNSARRALRVQRKCAAARRAQAQSVEQWALARAIAPGLSLSARELASAPERAGMRGLSGWRANSAEPFLRVRSRSHRRVLQTALTGSGQYHPARHRNPYRLRSHVHRRARHAACKGNHHDHPARRHRRHRNWRPGGNRCCRQEFRAACMDTDRFRRARHLHRHRPSVAIALGQHWLRSAVAAALSAAVAISALSLPRSAHLRARRP